MARILDVEQALLLLELEALFDQRVVQLARGGWPNAGTGHRSAGPAPAHQRDLQAINEAADQLEQLAEHPPGRSRAAPSELRPPRAKAREEAGRRAYEADQRASSGGYPTPSVRVFPITPSSTPTCCCDLDGRWDRQRASNLREGDEVQQWAASSFHTVCACTVSLQFVDFSKPDQPTGCSGSRPPPTPWRRRPGVAAQRLMTPRDASRGRPPRLMRRSGRPYLPAAARAVRDWARVETIALMLRNASPPGSTRTWGAWTWWRKQRRRLSARRRRLGLGRFGVASAQIDGSAHSRLSSRPSLSVHGLLDLALVHTRRGRRRCRPPTWPTALDPESPRAWSRPRPWPGRRVTERRQVRRCCLGYPRRPNPRPASPLPSPGGWRRTAA